MEFVSLWGSTRTQGQLSDSVLRKEKLEVTVLVMYNPDWNIIYESHGCNVFFDKFVLFPLMRQGKGSYQEK